MRKSEVGNRKYEVGRLAALAIIGLMLATAFSGCLGGEKEAGVSQEQSEETVEEELEGVNETINETKENIIFADNFDDNKMDPLWKTADCDNDDPTTFEEKEGMMQIFAGGKDMNERYGEGVDEYAAVYHSKIDGDFNVTVKVLSLELDGVGAVPENDYFYPGIWAHAGIMIRNDISAAGSSTGYVFMCAQKTFWAFYADTDDNGYVEDSNGFNSEDKTVFPCWLKIAKKEKTFTGFYSVDGTNWKQLGNFTINSANPSQDVGLFGCAVKGLVPLPVGYPNQVYNGCLSKFDDFVISR